MINKSKRELTVEQIEARRFFADLETSFLYELSRALNFEVTRALRDEKDRDICALLDKDAEWLKTILPSYIDAEVKQLKATLGELDNLT